MESVILILILLYMLHDMPVISVYYPTAVYAGVTVLTVLLIVSRINWKSFKQIIPFVLLPSISIFFSFDSLITYSGWALLLQLFVYPLIAFYILFNNMKRTGAIVFWTYLIFQIIICITTIVGLNVYPEASRAFGHGDFAQSEEFVLYRMMNIGGFTFIYTLVLSIPLVVSVFRFGPKYFHFAKVSSRIALLFLLLSLYTIYLSQYATALIFAIFSLALSFANRKLKFGVLLSIFLLGLFLYFLLKQPIASLLLDIADQTEGVAFKSRLEDIAYTMQGKSLGDDSDLAARQVLWEKSINAFISNPLGTWSNKSIGGHSQWFDAFGRFGIFAIFFITMIIRNIKSFLLRPIQNNIVFNPVLISILTVFLLGFFNPSFNTDFLLFVIPMFLYIFSDINLLKPLTSSNQDSRPNHLKN